jgi:hypothetical protein
MTRNVSVAPYAALLIGVVVGVDLLFFRYQIWERLIVNRRAHELFAACNALPSQ